MKDTLGKKLRDYRLNRLWTMERMAEETGLAQSTIYLLENDKTNPTDLTLARLRKMLPDLFGSGEAA